VARKKMTVVCTMCDGDKPSGTHDFIVFHCLAFCSPDCHEEYRTADEGRRERREREKTLRAA
jgi:hypothetical protein